MIENERAASIRDNDGRTAVQVLLCRKREGVLLSLLRPTAWGLQSAVVRQHVHMRLGLLLLLLHGSGGRLLQVTRHE